MDTITYANGRWTLTNVMGKWTLLMLRVMGHYYVYNTNI